MTAAGCHIQAGCQHVRCWAGLPVGLTGPKPVKFDQGTNPIDSSTWFTRFLPHSRGEYAVFAFNLIYMFVSLVAAVVRQNREFVFYLVVMAVLIVVVWIVHRRIHLTLGTLWALSIWGLAHMAGGLMPIPESFPIKGETYVLYNLWLVPGWLKYDQLVHAFGFGIVTWVCWQGIQKAFADNGVSIKPTLGLMSLCVAAGMGFGAANEVVEFMATLLVPETNVGGYVNTGWDLVANLFGCLLAAMLISILSAGKTTGST